MKRPKFLLCFDDQNDITNEEEDMMFASELELFSIGTISLPLKTLEIVVDNIVQIEKTTNTKTKPFCNFRNSAETTLDKNNEVSLEDKVYLETYYHHTLG